MNNLNPHHLGRRLEHKPKIKNAFGIIETVTGVEMNGAELLVHTDSFQTNQIKAFELLLQWHFHLDEPSGTWISTEEIDPY